MFRRFQRNRRYLYLMLGIFFLLLSSSVAFSMNNSDYPRTILSPRKAWTVLFNKGMDLEYANEEYLYIQDSHGKKIQCEYSIGGDVQDEWRYISLMPVENYFHNERYSVHVSEDILSYDGERIRKPYTYHFIYKEYEELQDRAIIVADYNNHTNKISIWFSEPIEIQMLSRHEWDFTNILGMNWENSRINKVDSYYDQGKEFVSGIEIWISDRVIMSNAIIFREGSLRDRYGAENKKPIIMKVEYAASNSYNVEVSNPKLFNIDDIYSDGLKINTYDNVDKKTLFENITTGKPSDELELLDKYNSVIIDDNRLIDSRMILKVSRDYKTLYLDIVTMPTVEIIDYDNIYDMDLYTITLKKGITVAELMDSINPSREYYDCFIKYRDSGRRVNDPNTVVDGKSMEFVIDSLYVIRVIGINN